MRRFMLQAGVILTLLCMMGIGIALASAPALPRSPELAYATERDGNGRIYLLALRHGLYYPITDTSAIDRQPVWSPDGKAMVFESLVSRRFNLFITHMDEPLFNKRQLTGSLLGDTGAIWSPDGSQRIIFVAEPGTYNSVNMLDLANTGGQNTRFNLTGSENTAYAPHWAAHGEVVYVSIRDTVYDLFALDPISGEERQITDDPYIDSSPMWSPDGRYIAYQSYRADGAAILVVDASGENVRLLTENAGNNIEPVWSPDGNRLAFTSRRDGNEEIYVVDVDDPDSVLRLTHHPGADRDPTWSPDGRYIAFVSFRDGNSEIYVMRSDGSNRLQRVTTHPGEDMHPAWRP